MALPKIVEPVQCHVSRDSADDHDEERLLLSNSSSADSQRHATHSGGLSSPAQQLTGGPAGPRDHRTRLREQLKNESLERINSISEKKRSFYSYTSCKRLWPSRQLGPSRSRKLRVKTSICFLIEFIRSKLSLLVAHANGATVQWGGVCPEVPPRGQVDTASVNIYPGSGPFIRMEPMSRTPYTWAEKFESFERTNSILETNGNFDSCNSCKRLGTSRLHELHESKFPFVSRIEFIRSKLSNFSAHVYGVNVTVPSLRGDKLRSLWRGVEVMQWAVCT